MNPPERPPGRIITFYSYKGGTGRSMAVANVAWILASNQRRVLVIDWDLEAPGLHRYFHPFLDDKELDQSPGVIDYFVDFATSARAAGGSGQGEDEAWYRPFTDLIGYSRSLDWDFGEGYLDLVPAGRQGPAYGVRVSQFNWEEFYSKLGGGLLLEGLKDRLRKDYDYILIDSRTGISDTSGVCTVQMPDDLVVCFTLNRQSIMGAAAVAQSALDQRRKPSGEPGLRVWPVPMRVEIFEKDRLERARELARRTFAPFLAHLPRSEREYYWGGIEVLYQPYFAYEEVLATFADRRRQTSSLLASMEQLAGRISDVTELGPMTEAERQRGLALYVAPKAAPEGRLNGAILVVYRKNDEYRVQPLIAILRSRFGAENVFAEYDSLELGADWESATFAAIDRAQVVLAAVTPIFSMETGSQYVRQLLRAYEQRKVVVPVLLGGSLPEPGRVPEEIQWFPRLNGIEINPLLGDTSYDRLIAGLERLLSRAPASDVPYNPDDPQKGQWGGVAVSRDFVLEASVSELSPTWFEVRLAVKPLDSARPLTQPVTFHLHPTFQPSDRTVQPVDGEARLVLQGWGAFTVGASTSDGRVLLELDLAEVPGAPAWFREH